MNETDEREPLDQAIAEHDVSRALTPGQLLLITAGVMLALRWLRAWRAQRQVGQVRDRSALARLLTPR